MTIAEIKKIGYNSITLPDMKAFISENAPDDKATFVANAYRTYTDKKGVEKKAYSHLKAKKWFCLKYCPEIVPKKKATVSDGLEDWV